MYIMNMKPIRNFNFGEISYQHEMDKLKESSLQDNNSISRLSNRKCNYKIYITDKSIFKKIRMKRN